MILMAKKETIKILKAITFDIEKSLFKVVLLFVVTLEERLPLAHDPALVLSSISVGERHRNAKMRGNTTERHGYRMCRVGEGK